MESLIYEDSPLANYLEGKDHETIYISLEHYLLHLVTGEGERDQEWIPQNLEQPRSSDVSMTFAPNAKSTFQSRIRKNLPVPLSISNPRGHTLLNAIRRFCSVCQKGHVTFSSSSANFKVDLSSSFSAPRFGEGIMNGFSNSSAM